MSALRLVAWLSAGVAFAGLACSSALEVLAGPHGDGVWFAALWVVATLSSTGVGLVLATRGARNPIGWLLLGNGIVLAATGLASAYARYAVVAEPGSCQVAPGRCSSPSEPGRCCSPA